MPMSPLALISTGTALTIIGAILIAVGGYREKIASQKDTDSIVTLTRLNNQLIQKQQTLVEDSRDSVIKTFNNKLEEFGLRYDEGQEKIEKIITINSKSPYFDFATENALSSEFRGNDLYLRINFSSFDATSYNIEGTVQFVSEDSSGKLTWINLVRPMTSMNCPESKFIFCDNAFQNAKKFDTQKIFVQLNVNWESVMNLLFLIVYG